MDDHRVRKQARVLQGLLTRCASGGAVLDLTSLPCERQLGRQRFAQRATPTRFTSIRRIEGETICDRGSMGAHDGARIEAAGGAARRRIGARRNPPFAREPRAGYGFASNPPYAPMPAVCRDLPVGRECVRSPSLLLSRKRFRSRNRLRLKAKFRRAFNSMTPVQICSEKYSALRSAKISRIFLASRLVQGAFRDRHGRGGGQRWPREIAAFFFECGRTIASRTAKPCGPGAPTLALSSWCAQRAL